MQVGVAVIADRGGPVAVDGGEIVVVVPVPAAARAIIANPLAQPMPLRRADCRFRVQDQAGDLLAAPVVLSGLVTGQPSAARAWPCSMWTGRPLAALSVTCCPHSAQVQVSGG